jgi:hypothetical protein
MGNDSIWAKFSLVLGLKLSTQPPILTSEYWIDHAMDPTLLLLKIIL